MGVSKKLSNIILISVIVLLVAALTCSSLVILKKNSQISEMNETISQNELNEIMDTFVRRDIHRFGKTTKLVL